MKLKPFMKKMFNNLFSTSFPAPSQHHEYFYNILHIFKYINLHEKREKNNNVLLTLKSQIFFLYFIKTRIFSELKNLKENINVY